MKMKEEKKFIVVRKTLVECDLIILDRKINPKRIEQ